MFVARNGRHELTPVVLSRPQVMELVERMLKASGRRLDISQPFVDAMLPGGHRLHVVLEGISRGYSAVNIRKFVVKAARLDDLVTLGSLTPDAARFLHASVVAGLNIVVAGGTQAGKTTMLNALAASIPGGQRVVSAEEVFELDFRHPDWVALQTRQQGLEGTGEVRLRDLVKESLRMRPSRIIVGEVRAEECLDLLLALNAGLPGMASIHANSARETLVKMCTLPLLAGENISARFVVPTVASSVDLVVHLGIDQRGHPPGRGDRRGAGSRRGRRDRDSSRSSSAVAASWSGARGFRRGRRGSSRPGSTCTSCSPELRDGRRRRARSGHRAAPGVVGLRRPERRVAPATHRVGCVSCSTGPGLVSMSVRHVDGALHGPPARRASSPSSWCRARCPVAVAFGVMAGYPPFAVVAGRARRRQRELAEVWPDAVDNLASAVRAGMSLGEAVGGLGERGPEPLREPFRAFARDYQVSGRFEDCLDLLKDRLADPVGDRVVEGLRVAREVGGGDLGRLLRNLSGHLRDDARTRAELEARQSWAVNAARLAVAAPWLVLLLMCFQPDVISRYASPTGAVVLALGAGLCVVAYRLMLRIGRLPVETRVLS